MADTASLIARVKTEGVTQATDQLEDFTTAAGEAEQGAKKLGDGVNKAQPKMQRLGNIAGQAGFQISDFVVQIQSGTSAFVAFTQQGSQLFGAINPLLGLVATLAGVIGGALYNSLSDAADASEKLKESQKDVDAVLQLTEKGVYDVSDAFVTYVASGADVEQQTARIALASAGLGTQLKQLQKDFLETAETANKSAGLMANTLSLLGQGAIAQNNAAAAVTARLGDQAKAFGITTKEMGKYQALQQQVAKNASPENVKALTDFTAALTKAHPDNKALADTNNKLQDQRYQLEQNAKQQQAVADAIKRAQTVIKDREKLEADIENRRKQREANAAAAAAKREAAAAARGARETQRQQKQADDFLSTLARQNSDELAAIDAQEQQKLEKLNEFNEKGNLTQQQYEEAKTQIALDADAKRNDLLQKQTEDRMKQQNSADSFLEQLRAQNEGELAEIDRQQEIKLKKLQEFYDKGLVSEGDYQKAIKDIQDDADKKRLDSYTDTLSDTTSALKTALGEGSALYKAAAITETIINTYKAATGAYSALAPIPIVGPALGAVAAGAAVAAGLANVAKIRSAREQGGTVAAGSAFVGGERGKPEVITAAGASRVRTMEQMQQMMGGAKNNQPPQISIINQTSGRIDSVEQQQDDEGRLRLIIRETVATDMQDSNSQISKSRRATRGQPGFAT